MDLFVLKWPAVPAGPGAEPHIGRFLTFARPILKSGASKNHLFLRKRVKYLDFNRIVTASLIADWYGLFVRKTNKNHLFTRNSKVSRFSPERYALLNRSLLWTFANKPNRNIFPGPAIFYRPLIFPAPPIFPGPFFSPSPFFFDGHPFFSSGPSVGGLSVDPCL